MKPAQAGLYPRYPIRNKHKPRSGDSNVWNCAHASQGLCRAATGPFSIIFASQLRRPPMNKRKAAENAEFAEVISGEVTLFCLVRQTQALWGRKLLIDTGEWGKDRPAFPCNAKFFSSPRSLRLCELMKS